jgi:hypothetical protein
MKFHLKNQPDKKRKEAMLKSYCKDKSCKSQSQGSCSNGASWGARKNGTNIRATEKRKCSDFDKPLVAKEESEG